MHSARPNVFRLHEQGQVRPPPPGRLTYKLDADELRRMEIGVALQGPQEEIWTREPIDEPTKLRLLPASQLPADWRLVLVMKRQCDNCFWLKGAMVNVNTGKVALLSASTRQAIVGNGNRPIKSHDAGFYVGQYVMLAPLAFWTTLKYLI